MFQTCCIAGRVRSYSDLCLLLLKDGERLSNPALWWVNDAGEEIKWSFEELGSRSRRAANILAGACDLQPGDRLLLILPRVPEWWLVNVACLRTGRCCVAVASTPSLGL